MELHFDRDALVEIAKKSIERKTGARGLRAIMENVMMDYMYTIPSDDSIEELTITKDIVDDNMLLEDKSTADIVSIDVKMEEESA